MKLLHNLVPTTPIALPQMMRHNAHLNELPQKPVGLLYEKDEVKSPITSSLKLTDGGQLSYWKALTTSVRPSIDLWRSLPLEEPN